jgi:hypothetical protein
MATTASATPLPRRVPFIMPIDSSDLDRPIERPIARPSPEQVIAFEAGEKDYHRLMQLGVSPTVQLTPAEPPTLPASVTVAAEPAEPVNDTTGSATDPEDYPLAMPRECAYGWLAEQAEYLGGPFGWSYLSLLTLSAPRVQVETDFYEAIRPALYAGLLGPAGVGKSRTMDRAHLMLGRTDFEVEVRVPGSDRGLYEIFAKVDQASVPPKMVLLQDELRTLMSKINIQGSSLAPALCTLYYKDEVGGAVKGKALSAFVRLSILGGLKASDPMEFREMFGSETAAGLFDRFIFAPGPSRWLWNDEWQLPACEVDEEFGCVDPGPRKGWPVKVTKDVFERVKAWRAERPDLDRGRRGELAMRVAAISVSMNEERTVSPACLEAALRFAEWQERVKTVYSPGEARNPDAVLTAEMLAAFEEAHKLNPNSWQRFRDMSRDHSWNRKFGPVTTRVRDSLVRDGFLEEEMGEDDKGNERRMRNPRYRLMV